MSVSEQTRKLEQPRDQAKLVKLASTASVMVVVFLIVIKLWAWFLTGSVSLLASLLDSTMDAAASIFNFVAIRYSLKPADDEHRFGHGKAQSIAGLIQSAFIAGSAALLWLHAISRLMDPKPLQSTETGIIVMAISLVMTIGLVILQKYVVQKTHSAAIEADSLHYVGDILVNASIIAILFMSTWLWEGADATFGILIALYIFYNAATIAYKSAQALLDRELPDEQRNQIVSIVEAHPEVLGQHELRTRESGHMQFIQLHVDMDQNMNLKKAHDVIDEIENELLEHFPHADILIHSDPV
jgi:ferrous-iron efflux pump FieF